MSDFAAQKKRYTFANDEFNLEYAYHDCKLVFDGITDDDSFQEADSGLIFYYANEIIYALQKALEWVDKDISSDDIISRQAAIDALGADPMGGLNYEGILGRLPSAQLDISGYSDRLWRTAYERGKKEIVYCKDCIHHFYEGDIPYCNQIDYGYGWEDDDFCSFAERRTDE